MIRSTLIALTLSLPILASAAIPVTDRSAYDTTYAGSEQGMNGTATGGGASAPLSAQGQLFMQLQQMQQEIATLRGLLEEQQYELRQLRQENLERYQTLDSRLNDAGSAQAPGQSAASGQQESNATQPAVQAPAGEADPEKEKLFYDASFDLIKARDFDKAQQAFSAFLRKYPNSQYAGNAQYWLGEVHLVQGDLQAAGKAFALVSHNYSEHNKVPDSLYKLADVERRLGNADKARGILQQVIAQYPNSSAAQLAQQDLGKL
ncbi:MAG TPA: tol-pal system protein YbgF [Gammaproteobacteria bacterium]|nr:tol-pal system protein YbgF [Gammaproteobacteria bacterium]